VQTVFQMQDLALPGEVTDDQIGCSKTHSICSKDGPPCSDHGSCISSIQDPGPICLCDIGYTGEKCDQSRFKKFLHLQRVQQTIYKVYRHTVLCCGDAALEMVFFSGAAWKQLTGRTFIRYDSSKLKGNPVANVDVQMLIIPSVGDGVLFQVGANADQLQSKVRVW
jgi:hypothetical protein